MNGGAFMDIVFSPRATPPAGHYSQAVRANGFLFVSGQLGFLSRHGSGAPARLADGIAAQTEAALASLGAILEAAGAGPGAVASVTVYVADIAHWPEVNRAYERYFGAHRPARTVVPCGALHYGALVEISAIAVA